jgi:hypothetical protein
MNNGEWTINNKQWIIAGGRLKTIQSVVAKAIADKLINEL